MSLYPENPEIGEVFNNRQWSGTAWVALNNPLSVEYTTDGEFTQHTSASANVHGIINSASVVYADDAKLSDERTPLNQSVTDSKIVAGGLSASVISGSAVVQNDLDAYLTQSSASTTYAPSASPTFTGTVALPLTTNYDGTQLSTTLGSKLPIAGGKILQIVRATDGTQRNTSSTTYVDASISVSITPINASSNILVLWQALAGGGSNNYINRTITDASNSSLSGAELGQFGDASSLTPVSMYPVIGWVAASNTSARTYKGRFSVTAGTATLFNNASIGQMYAIEVSA